MFIPLVAGSLGVVDHAASRLAGPAGLWAQAAAECKKAQEPSQSFADEWASCRAAPRDRAALSLLVRRGVPRDVRPEVWRHCLLGEQSEDLQHLYRSEEVPDGVAKLIDVDAPRTFSSSAEFKGIGGPEKIRVALRRFAAANADIGYVQSLNFVAGMLLLGLGGEREVPAALGAVVSQLQARGWYTAGMEQLRADSLVLRDLLQARLPVIHGAFLKHGFEPLLVSPRWFMTLFTVTLEGDALHRAWDAILADGIEAVFRISLALFARKEEEVLRAQSLDDITALFLVAQTDVSPDVLMAAAYHKSLLGSSLDRTELERRRRLALANVSSSDEHSPGGGIAAAKALAPYLFARGTRELMDVGRRQRGGEGEEGYTFGDLSRGIASRVESRIKHGANQVESQIKQGAIQVEAQIMRHLRPGSNAAAQPGQDEGSERLLVGNHSGSQSLLVGLWQYGEASYCEIRISEAEGGGGGGLLFQWQFAGSGRLSGVLHPEGNLHAGSGFLDDGTPLGALRLWLEGGTLVAQFQPAGEAAWSQETRAHRAEEPAVLGSDSSR